MAKSKKELWRNRIFSLVGEAAAFDTPFHAVPEMTGKSPTRRAWSRPAFTGSGSQVKQEHSQDAEVHIRR